MNVNFIKKKFRKKNDKMTPEEREIFLKEYESLRMESQNSRQNANQILTFGLAAIALVFMGCIGGLKKNTIGNTVSALKCCSIRYRWRACL